MGTVTRPLFCLMQGLGQEGSHSSVPSTFWAEIGEGPATKVLPGLLAMLTKGRARGRQCLVVIRQIGQPSMEAIPRIGPLYDKADTKRRLYILRALADIDREGERSIPLIVKALDDPEAKERREAIITLIRYRAKAEKFLKPAMKSLGDSDPETRKLALGLVRGLGPKAAEAAQAIIGLTKDSDPKVRISAISSLGVLGPPTPETVGALEASIHDDNVNIRGAAVRTLRTLGLREPAKVVPVLAKAQEAERDEGLRRSISAAINAITKKNAQPGTPAGKPDNAQGGEPEQN